MNKNYSKISKIDKIGAFWKKFRTFKEKSSVFCIENLQFFFYQIFQKIFCEINNLFYIIRSKNFSITCFIQFSHISHYILKIKNSKPLITRFQNSPWHLTIFLESNAANSSKVISSFEFVNFYFKIVSTPHNLSRRIAGVWYLCQFSEEALTFYPFRSFYVYLDGARAVRWIGWLVGVINGRGGCEVVGEGSERCEGYDRPSRYLYVVVWPRVCRKRRCYISKIAPFYLFTPLPLSSATLSSFYLLFFSISHSSPPSRALFNSISQVHSTTTNFFFFFFL